MGWIRTRRVVFLALAAAVAVAGHAPATGATSRATATISVHMTTNAITLGQVTYVAGSVTPPKATARVVVQRRTSRWGDRQAGAVKADGTFKIGIKPSEAGIYALRVRSNGGSVVSNVVYLRVRPNPSSGGGTPPTTPPTTRPPASPCDPNYSGCVPIASDVDCAGGSGNGPAYVEGPVTVIGTDIYKLDNDNDGIGCE